MKHQKGSPVEARVVLGLDLGPNSVGWALVEEGAESARLIDTGVRVFPEGVDNYGTTKQKSKNQDRRVARGQRRQIIRRKRRKQKLREALTRLGLYDPASPEWAAAVRTCPYSLRAAALERKLEPGELARVLLHLSQRRGFLSNRKTDSALKDEKTTSGKEGKKEGILDQMKSLEKTLRDSGQTLGQYLAQRAARPGEIPLPDKHRIRKLHTTRAAFFQEFERIWAAQAVHYPTPLNDNTRWGTTGPRPALQPHKPRALKKGADWLSAYGVEGIIFFQRPMYWPAEMIGRCELEPREYRCPRADRTFQRFKILCDVNALRYLHPLTREPVALDATQRAAVVRLLSGRADATFDQIRAAAKLTDNCRFTLESKKKTKLGGHKTDDAMRKAAKTAGFDYASLAEEVKDELVRLIADPRIDDFNLRRELVDRFGLTDEQAQSMSSAALPSEYGNLSLLAMRRILPHLDAGKILMANNAEDSALHAAGYNRRDERLGETVNELPALDRIHTGPLADVANPVVVAALHEVRKVVNLLVKTYGRPDGVHVELARDMKMGKAAREEYEARLKEREERREAAKSAIHALGHKPTRDAIDRWLLWQEQGERCVYSGKIIGAAQLFGGGVDIDHILPWSQSLDDSKMNKVVCFRRENQEKGQRTVHQWLAAADPDKYEAVLQNAQELPLRKRERFKVEKVVLTDFIQRQLVDTGYITRLATHYLGMLVGQKNVLGGKGAYTAELRWQWGLDTVLSDIPDSPAWQEVHRRADEFDAQASEAREAGDEEKAEELAREARKLRENGLGEKNRADHRHHAIDAIVIALTNPKRLQQLARISRDGGTRATGEVLHDPWPNFRRSVLDRIATVNVSHRVQRKVAGPLHEDTQYTPVRVTDPDLADEGALFAVRKPLVSLTDSEIPRIRDPYIRELVQSKLGISGGRAKKGAKREKPGKEQKQQREAILSSLTFPNGVPIKTVRITKPEKTIRMIREGKHPAYVKPGRNHHLVIFEHPGLKKPEREAVFVPMIEAISRLKESNSLPVIRRVHPVRKDARFVMSLSMREMVLMQHNGKEVLATYITAASTTSQMAFKSHTDARKSEDAGKITKYPSSFHARKVTVDPIGRIRWAND